VGFGGDCLAQKVGAGGWREPERGERKQAHAAVSCICV